MTADSFLWGLPLIAGRPRPLRFCGGKPNKLASRRRRVTTQTWLRTAARNSQLVDHAAPDTGVRSRIKITSFFELCQELLGEYEPENTKLYDNVTWKLAEH